jgi:serine/threonine protein kinase
VIGTRINNYEIVALIGEGGMGNVYLARHALIGREVAVKVLHAQLAADQGLVKRFINEAQAATAIRHPNIIYVMDAGLLPDSGRPYITMELLSGENLARRLARAGTLSVAQAIDVARQTASALAAAHAKGIIHRDLKPDNLFLVPHGSLPGHEVVKVLDFGIAKLRSEIGDLKAAAPVQTQTGILMGTPPYMSPEQCKGVSTQIDLRTDVYALGIILFEMVCGRTPFSAAGFGELLVMHILKPPPPPRSINPQIPEALEALILKALAKLPEERFAGMADFEAALGGVPLPGSATLEGLAPPPPREASGPTAGAPRAVRPSPSGSVGRAQPPPPSAPSHHAVVVDSGQVRAQGPAKTTTFRATSGEISADMEELALVRTRRPLVLGIAFATIVVAGIGFGLTRLPGPTPKTEAPDPATQRPAAPPQVVHPQAPAAPAARRVPPTTKPAELTPESLPPALKKYVAPPDAGVAPGAARPARKPTTAKPTSPRPPGKSGPEKW